MRTGCFTFVPTLQPQSVRREPVDISFGSRRR
jgi:hypothetical protein